MKRVKIRVVKDVTDIFPEYRPEVGKVYEAKYVPRTRRKYNDRCCVGAGEFCMVNMLDKKIVLRSGEYEILTED